MFKKLLDLGNIQLKKTRHGVQVMFFKQLAIKQEIADFREKIGALSADNAEIIKTFKEKIFETDDTSLIKDYYLEVIKVYKNRKDVNDYNLAEFNNSLFKKITVRLKKNSLIDKQDKNIKIILKDIKFYLSKGWAGNYGLFIRFLERNNIIIENQ